MKEKIKIFIIKEIEKLSEKFPKISFKYGFDAIGKQHLIEVEPDTEFRTERYMNSELDIIDAFINEFPEDEILFISNNKYIKIEKPIYIKEGLINVDSNLVSNSLVPLFSSANLISAPFPKMNFFINKLENVEISKPLTENKNNIIEPTNISLNIYIDSYAMAA